MQLQSPVFTRSLFTLVLLISCAHALVHIYELALPSVEQLIAAEYRPGDVAAGKLLSGEIANYWRLPFGVGALFAGLLVDRLGSRRMLAVYLFGCAATALVVGLVQPLGILIAAMFAMGTFGSIYHPAGLALISHESPPELLPRALGLHGIFGSLGIGGAPFLAGAVLSLTDPPNWRNYYLLLVIPGVVLGTVFFLTRKQEDADALDAADFPAAKQRGVGFQPANANKEQRNLAGKMPAAREESRWGSFFILTLFAVLMGLTYAGVISFLPRYIAGAKIESTWLTSAGLSNYLAGGVLIIGCVGQYFAGRIARPHRLEPLLLAITLGNLPGLVGMAFATGWWRVIAAGTWAIVHFMHQPIYNSLIASYTPRSRRSLAYGFSFAMGFGFGSFGARFAGASTSDFVTYGTLAGLVVIGGGLCGLLWVWNPKPIR